MQIRPNTSMAAVPGTDFSGLANLMAMKGRGGDNTLVHMSKAELPYLNMLAKSAGYQQGLPVNPETGLPEANILKTILPVAGAILGGMFLPGALPAFLGKGALATGVGAGLGSFGGSLLSGRSLKDAAIGGLISGGLSGLGAATFGGQSFMGDTTSFAGDATAAEIARSNAAAIAGKEGAAGFADVGGGAGLTGVDTSYPLSELSIGLDPGTSPLYTNPNIRVLGADGASLQALPTQYFRGPASELGYGLVDPNVAGNMLSPSAQEYIATNVGPAFTPSDAKLALGTDIGGTGFATPTAVTNADYVKALQAKDLVGKDFGVGDLREGFQATQSSLDAVQGMSKPSFLSFPKSYDPKLGLDRFDFLKTQLKPAATVGAVGIGIDAATGQGAFEPIDYSSFPQAGEERRVSPFDTSGIRFASRRTGAFPRTEEEALAFAQPGGTRRRFFDQGFFTSAKTGGGLADLEVKRFFEGGGGDSGDDPGDEGVAGPDGDDSDDDSGEPGGGEFGGFGDEFGGLGAVSGVAGAADAAAAAAADAALAEQTLTVPTPRTTEEDIEEDLFDVEMALPTPIDPTPDVADMYDFGPVSRSDIADKLGGRAVNPGISRYGYQSGIGRGTFGGYTSSDIDTAKSDVDQGFATAPVGSFSPFGFATDVAKTALNVAVPGLGFAADVAQQASKPAGTGTLGAIANVLGDEEDESEGSAPAKAEGGLLKMAQGGSFLEQMLAGGLGTTDEAQDMLGKLPKPITALLGGASAPMLAEKLIGKPAGDITAPPPPVRAMEAPVEAPPPPTDEELEEMRNIAMMQQVLSGIPVEAQAGGLISAYQMGGPPSPYFEGMVKGRGDGMSDSIPFTIEGTQPAILSRDEYVLPADIVSMMGNGSSDAGAEKIDTFINDFRVQKYGRGKQPPETRRGLSGVA